MTEKPFVHKEAFVNVKTCFVYHDIITNFLFKILDQKGIINVGGKAQYIYNFAKKGNKNVNKIYLRKNSNTGFPFDSLMNLSKLNRLLKILD